jgi:hypothetical protein
MPFSTRSLLVPFTLLALASAGCDSADDSPHPITAGLEVYGFAITTVGSPEVDPYRVCGRPTRTSGFITAVPNPYLGLSVYEADPANRILRFINVPGRVRIEIVRAYWHTRGPSPSLLWTAGGLVRVVPSTGRTVRVIEKDSPSRSIDWDLRDEAGELVPSGFYRVFFTVDEGLARALGFDGPTVYDDIYVIQREDSGITISVDGGETETLGDGSWVDPTGCI